MRRRGFLQLSRMVALVHTGICLLTGVKLVIYSSSKLYYFIPGWRNPLFKSCKHDTHPPRRARFHVEFLFKLSANNKIVLCVCSGKYLSNINPEEVKDVSKRGRAASHSPGLVMQPSLSLFDMSINTGWFIWSDSLVAIYTIYLWSFCEQAGGII